MGTAAAAKSERYVFVDALRGVAAVMVLVYHVVVSAEILIAPGHFVPGWLQAISHNGTYGVQVFFVLSGFVIAHSLRDNPLTRASIGRFMLRRQIRLDPPYWTMLTISLLLIVVVRLIPALKAQPSLPPLPLPGVGVVLANFFYLHNLLEVEQILGVAWTLCLEVQFYVVFILLLALGAKISKTGGSHSSRSDTLIGAPTLCLVYGTGVLSLLLIHLPDYYAYFFRYWFYFAAGALAYWAFRGKIHQPVFGSFVILYAFSAAWSLLGTTPPDSQAAFPAQRSDTVPLLVGLATALLLWNMGRRGLLARVGNNPVLQYLGAVSYSLYLIHIHTTVIVLRLGYKITGMRPAAGVLWMLLSVVFSLIAAHLLHLLVEKPSIKLAARCKSQPN